MDVIRRDDAVKTEILPGVFKTPKALSDNLEILELELAPGAALEPHDMLCRVTFCVLEGTGVFTYAESRERVPAGDMVTALAGQVRFWANEEASPVRILVIKSLREK